MSRKFLVPVGLLVSASDPTGVFTAGDTYFNSTAGVIKTYNGAAWVAASGTQGVQGTTGSGSQGTQGAQGTLGGGSYWFSAAPPTLQAVGDRWVQSISLNEYTYINEGGAGKFVDTRPAGYTGTQGTTGAGTQGTQGTQGVQGLTGTGTQGTQGTQGVQGLTGAGTQGTQGVQGTAGVGSQGTQGTQGVQGLTGTGSQGTQGTIGITGIQSQSTPPALQSILWADTSATGTPYGSITINTQTASYTLALTDASCLVEMNVATGCTLTVPPNSTVAFPVGSVVDVEQYGAGQVTFTPGAGVTIRSTTSKLKLTGQYSAATLYKRGTDEWVLNGDLTI
jgi:hypothetical protein